MSLSAFLKENATNAEEITFAPSSRYRGEDGKAIQWRIKPIDGRLDGDLRQACQRRVPIPGRKNQYQNETDVTAYLGKLAAACTVYPDLNDRLLQDSYGVLGAENLLKAMLIAGEYTRYLEKVQEACGFDVPMAEEVETAKN